MKKNKKSALKAKLLTAFKKVIKKNHANLSNKSEKLLEKAVKKIVKKTSKKKNGIPKSEKLTSAKVPTTVLHPHKFSLDGANGASPHKQTIQ